MKSHVIAILEKPYKVLFKDIVLVYVFLSNRIRFDFWILTTVMLLQAAIELLTVYSIRQLALVTSNAELLKSELPWRFFFEILPSFSKWAYTQEWRSLFLSACYVVLLILIKNIIVWIVMWRTAQLSENISQIIAKEMMYRYLNSNYTWHLSKKNKNALQNMLWRSNLASLLIQQLSSLTCFFY